jgi:hypothetical protein
MGGIRDHWKAQDPGPTSGGPRLLAAAHHQEAVGGEAQREVVMEAPPTPPLEVAEANFLLEFPVILLDPLAAFGCGDDVVEGRMARQGDQLANRTRGPDRPLEQRLFALSPVATDAHPDRGKASAQVRGDRACRLLRYQIYRCRLYRCGRTDAVFLLADAFGWLAPLSARHIS